ncbi:MAG: hypothetical protein PUE15_10440 [Prevotella sp.]|nr:hypothetical protein [Prevotella sp.]
MKRNRLIVLALMLIGLMNAQKVCAQQVSAQKWDGHTPAQVYSGSYTYKGETKTSDAAKVLYLYNLGTKQYLTKGGKWGTQAMSGPQGMAMRLVQVTGSSAYYLESSVKCETLTSGNGYIEFCDGTTNTSAADTLIFTVDQGRNKDATGSGRTTAQMTFTPVTLEGYTNIYQITITNNNSNAVADARGTFYLCSVKDSEITPKKDISGLNDNSDKWILVTQQDFLNYFEKAEASSASPVPAYFTIKDYDFARNDLNISEWKGGTERNVTIANNTPTPTTPDKAIPTTTTVTTTTYIYSGTCYRNGRYQGTFTRAESETKYDGITDKGTTATIDKNFLPCGHTHRQDITSQTIKLVDSVETTQKVTNVGYTYYVGNGYAETKTAVDEDGKTLSKEDYWQRLYGGKWTANIHGSEGSISQKVNITLRSGWYKVSCDGFTTDGKGYMFASVNGSDDGTTDQRAVAPFTQISSAPTTYVKASNLLSSLEGARQSVTVYVPRKESNSHEPAAESYIIFGAFTEGGSASSWTCVDNFSIEYLGDPDTDIIIDEDQTDFDYINGQVANDGNHTMRLHRTFKTDNWNSLVLPVNLTAGQVKTAFGGDTKLSVLEGAKEEAPNRIYFTKVDLTDNDATAINAGKLYIIKPQVEMTTLPAGSAAVERKVTEGDKTFNLSLRTYYTFNQVVLDKKLTSGDVSTKVVQGATDEGGLQMVGTYVKKSKEVDGTTAIPAYSYILGTPSDKTDSKWYYTKVAVNNVKGLRGWLETGKSAPNTDVKFFINGVEEGEVTAIEGIESSMEVSKRINSNIYNLNGQLVRSNSVSAEGLDKGIYIIGGKKVVVK